MTDLTVLAANVLVGRADTGALATVLERERPDLVSLPEAGPDFRDKLLPLVAELGYQAWASTAPGTSDGEGVVLLAAARMGALTVTSGREMRHRYLRATGGALGRRSFFAVHPEAPMGPMRTAWWRSDIAHLARWCAESPGPIVAGDFNATADNAAFRAVLRRCRSAADGTGQGPGRHVPRGGAAVVRHPDRPRAGARGGEDDPFRGAPRSRAATTARCWPGSACRRPEEGRVA